MVYFFYIETRYTPLEEIAKHFDGEVSDTYLTMSCFMLTSRRMLFSVAPLLLPSPRSLLLRLVDLTPLILVKSARRLRPGRRLLESADADSTFCALCRRDGGQLGNVPQLLNTASIVPDSDISCNAMTCYG